MTDDSNYSGMPEAAPMPEAGSDAATPDAPPNLNAAVGGMDEYPTGRGGMVAMPMPGGGAATAFVPQPLSPIGARPEPINMAAADLQDRTAS